MSEEAYHGYVCFYRYNGRWSVSVLDDPPSGDTSSRYYPVKIRVPRAELDRLGVQPQAAVASVDTEEAS